MHRRLWLASLTLKNVSWEFKPQQEEPLFSWASKIWGWFHNQTKINWGLKVDWHFCQISSFFKNSPWLQPGAEWNVEWNMAKHRNSSCGMEWESSKIRNYSYEMDKSIPKSGTDCLMEQKSLIVGQNYVKMEQNWIKPGTDVVIQKEALLSTLLRQTEVNYCTTLTLESGIF